MCMSDPDGSVLAIDPGETCGVAWMPMSSLLLETRDAAETVAHEQVLCEAGQYGRDPEVSCVNRLMMRIRKEDARIVVIEDSTWFLTKQGMHRTKASLVPVSLFAMLRFGLEDKWLDMRLEVQSPSHMSVASDSRMKSWGLWWPGEQHARDAARHLMVFMRRWKQEQRGA